ncbi:MAG: SDR family NAD(P)-dependent oxidoreductase [Iphinoe sp. HA4291-MV1]|nr:SDR family NAD(P)-dependent oxidoreductase [Iphinoe sp. HA4291-MV1]
MNQGASGVETFQQTSLDHNIQLGRVKLKPLCAPDWLDFTLSDHNICLLTDDGSTTSITLAKSLSQQGWKVVVLSFPESVITQQLPLPTGISRVVLANLSEEHLKQQLAAIAQNYGFIGAFIHLHPSIHNIREQESEKAILKHVFLMAKYLKKPLNEAARQGRSCFLTVTRLDGELGVGQKTDFSVISGGLFGLTKTLNLEWERVFCRAIDLSPDLDAESTAQSIIAELHDANRLIAEVGYSLQGRTILVGKNSAATKKINGAKSQITPSSVFVVSGGGKGITAHCVIKLAQRYQCKFILLGRSAISPEPSWAKDCVDELELKKRIIADVLAQGEEPVPVKVQKRLKAISSQRKIVQTLQAIEQVGGKAEYISVDITDAIALKRKLADVVQRFGAITGIIHGAGNLADKLIENKSEQDFEAVYAAKVQGLDNLLSCVNANQIKHLVLFSSAAGFYGNIGQSDYAIANEILNKFAHHFKRHYPECHVVSFNWGPWDGGMVTPELKQIFAQRNVEVIPIEVGTQILVDELEFGNQETVQVLVGSPLVAVSGELEPELRTYQIRRKLTLEANPFLQDHIIGGQAVLPAMCALAWIANVSEQLYPGYKFFSCENNKVLKGIIFDKTLASEYILEVMEIKKSPDNEIELAATIWSKTVTGNPRYHYSGQIKLLRQIPPIPTYETFDITQDNALLELSPYEDGTLFHGPSFQGVKRVLNISPEKLTMECILSEIDERKQGQIPAQAFNPYLVDVQIQSTLIWLEHFYQTTGLPLRLQRGEHFQAIPFDNTFFVSMEVQAITKTKLVSNVVAHDAWGKVYSRLVGIEATINKQLKHLFVPYAKTGVNLTK